MRQLSPRAESGRATLWSAELDNSYQPAAPFDLILMLDVIEHISKPRSAAASELPGFWRRAAESS